MRRPGLGSEFYDAVAQTIDLSQLTREVGTPRTGRLTHPNSRIARFPFKVVYRVRVGDIYVCCGRAYKSAARLLEKPPVNEDVNICGSPAATDASRFERRFSSCASAGTGSRDSGRFVASRRSFELTCRSTPENDSLEFRNGLELWRSTISIVFWWRGPSTTFVRSAGQCTERPTHGRRKELERGCPVLF